jgi:DNA-binding transcriptional MocR family regulator
MNVSTKSTKSIKSPTMSTKSMTKSTKGSTKSKSAFTKSHTSEVYRQLKVGAIERLSKFYTPTSINLAGGIPMDSAFPFESLQVNLSNNDSYKIEKGSSLDINYQRGDGMPELLGWIKEHVKKVLKPCQEVFNCVTIGSTDGLYKILTLIECDSVIFDEYSYAHAIATCEGLGKKRIGVKRDSIGMIPTALRETVINARAVGKTANLLYLIPSAHNPTGVSMSEQRKEEIYLVCQELDIIIIEDDAYYYLNYDVKDGEQLPGIRNLPRTFLSMDTDGRVLRLDTLAKTMSPGLRLGWITTTSSDFISKYDLLQEISSHFPSGFSQSIFYGLLNHWSDDQLHAHMQKIQKHYKSQRDATVNAILKYFALDEVTFVNPTCGMFIWLTFKVNKTSFELFQMFASAGVITVPASDFHIPGIDGKELCESNGSAVRLTFAASSPEQIEKAIEAMAKSLHGDVDI